MNSLCIATNGLLCSGSGTGGSYAVEYGEIVDVEDIILAIEADTEIILLEEEEIEEPSEAALENKDDDTALQG